MLASVLRGLRGFRERPGLDSTVICRRLFLRIAAGALSARAHPHRFSAATRLSIDAYPRRRKCVDISARQHG
jgi:hypothetical protein